MKPSIGLIGLRVMGSNLALNIESHGYPVAVFNRDSNITAGFVERFKDRAFVPAKTLSGLVNSLQRPRQIFMMIQAGSAVDSVIEAMLPLLDKGDILIDGGNSYFEDTARREKRCREAGIYFLGVGISGGEEGALKGPSIMPGGPSEAWEVMAPLFEQIAAQADGPCTAYIGPGGSGHFVKMVHNGIEYGDMQLIAEVYHLLRELFKATPEELAAVFEEWNKGVLSSYLIEITSQIFRKRDEEGSGFLVDKILDQAGQKGTGKWTIMEAAKLGVPIPTLAAAVDARLMSSMKETRTAAAALFNPPQPGNRVPDSRTIRSALHDALYCGKILAYAQGMALLAAASKEYQWNLKLGSIAAIWRGGCIIRARFLDEIRRAYEANSALPNLIFAPELGTVVRENVSKLRQVVQLAIESGIPVPALSAGLAYFDSLRSAFLPQNLSQAQRDFFGAHTYQRVDRPGVFHTDWR